MHKYTCNASAKTPKFAQLNTQKKWINGFSTTKKKKVMKNKKSNTFLYPKSINTPNTQSTDVAAVHIFSFLEAL